MQARSQMLSCALLAFFKKEQSSKSPLIALMCCLKAARGTRMKYIFYVEGERLRDDLPCIGWVAFTRKVYAIK